MTAIVNLKKDEEAGVWVAVSENVPGLVLEAEKCGDLIARVEVVLPELAKENGCGPFRKIRYNL